jgi:hypothetical protein
MTMDAHYPDGLRGGAHPGPASDCPDARCQQQPKTTPDDALRQRIEAALREHGMVHLGADAPADEYECCAAALLPLFAVEREAEAHLPVHRWRVEHIDGGNGWVPASGTKTDRDEALAQLRANETNRPTWVDGTPVQRRLVRETTTYTVEDAGSADATDGGA